MHFLHDITIQNAKKSTKIDAQVHLYKNMNKLILHLLAKSLPHCYELFGIFNKVLITATALF